MITSSINTQDTLYSVIPLVVNLEYSDRYISHFDTNYGDCQLFSKQELPSHTFNFAKKKFNILQGNNAKSINQVPFTTLLVGPSFACKQIMREFNQWAVIDENSLVNANTKDTQGASHTTTQAEIKVWKSVKHISVWAQATFSNVVVPTCFPQELQQELIKIFNFPIVVKVAPISANQTHNEFAVWLSAIYALTAARNLYRTVLCHSMTWQHYLQFFSCSTDIFSYIPSIWHPLLNEHSFLSNQFLNKFSSKNTASQKAKKQASLTTQALAKKNSNYDTKHAIFTSSNAISQKTIGMGSYHAPIVPTKTLSVLSNIPSFNIVLQYSSNTIELIVPFQPSENSQVGLQQLVAQSLQVSANMVSIKKDENTCPELLQAHSIFYPYHFALLANMTMQACKQKKATTTKPQQIKVHIAQCKTMFNQLAQATMVVEFEYKKYSLEFQLTQATIAIDIGKISNKNIVYGKIQEIFFSNLFALCGTNTIISPKIFSNFYIDIIEGATHTASLANIIHNTSREAIVSAMQNFKQHSNFPIGRM